MAHPLLTTVTAAAPGYIVRCGRNEMSTIAINASQQRLLDLIDNRLDELDTAAGEAVAGILAAADRLPPADRLYVQRRLQSIGVNTEWVSALDDHR